MSGLPRFRDPRNRWPAPGDALPAPFTDGRPHPEARAVLAQVVPTLSTEEAEGVARALVGQPKTRHALADVLLRLHPELFEPSDQGAET